MNAITTSGLRFGFQKGAPILHGLDLQVLAGSIFGFLGPNGAGKTTTMKLLLGLLEPTAGSIQYGGQEFKAHKYQLLKRIGSLIESPSLYGHLSATENLEVYRLTYGADKKRIPQVLELVGLGAEAHKKAGSFSLGMKQRLAIGLALLHDPDILMLDEPGNGLDPYGIIEMRELLQQLNREEGKTILVSSHQLEEVEKTATHIGIINRGQMVFQGTLQELSLRKAKDGSLEQLFLQLTQKLTP